jgi:hypothetical protein
MLRVILHNRCLPSLIGKKRRIKRLQTSLKIVCLLVIIEKLQDLILKLELVVSAKANRRVPNTCLVRVFNYKLGCFDDVHVLIYMDACPQL